MPFDPKVHVGVSAFIMDQGEVALLRRAGDRHGSGTWGLPGGWIDYGQTPESATEREALEEVGLSVKADTLLSVVSNTYPEEDMHVICINYLCDYVAGELENVEPEKASEVRWVDLQEFYTWPREDLFPPLADLRDQLIAENFGGDS